MTKQDYLKVIERIINSPRNDLQKITMLKYSFETYVEDHEQQHVNARWIVPDEWYPEICSNCLFEYCRDDDDDYIPKFCPECGAKMEEKVHHTYL